MVELVRAGRSPEELAKEGSASSPGPKSRRRTRVTGVASPQPLLDQGYTVFDVRHGSSPRLIVPEIVSNLRRAVRFIRVHASDFDIDPDRIGLWGAN